MLTPSSLIFTYLCLWRTYKLENLFSASFIDDCGQCGLELSQVSEVYQFSAFLLNLITCRLLWWLLELFSSSSEGGCVLWFEIHKYDLSKGNFEVMRFFLILMVIIVYLMLLAKIFGSGWFGFHSNTSLMMLNFLMSLIWRCLPRYLEHRITLGIILM